MSGDFISREEAITAVEQELQKPYVKDSPPQYRAGFLGAIRVLTDNVPAADVVPVHRGEWVEFDGEGTYQCSYCGEPFILMNGTPRDNEYNYCPKCGAYLREGLDGGEPHD